MKNRTSSCRKWSLVEWLKSPRESYGQMVYHIRSARSSSKHEIEVNSVRTMMLWAKPMDWIDSCQSIFQTFWMIFCWINHKLRHHYFWQEEIAQLSPKKYICASLVWILTALAVEQLVKYIALPAKSRESPPMKRTSVPCSSTEGEVKSNWRAHRPLKRSWMSHLIFNSSKVRRLFQHL